MTDISDQREDYTEMAMMLLVSIFLHRGNPRQRLIRILKKKGHEREVDELEDLGGLLKCVKFFKERKLITEVLYIAKQLEYVFIKEGDYVFEYGDQADSFFIIIQGCIGVLKPSWWTASLIGKKRSLKFNEKAVLKDGGSFGELALLQNKPRNASMLAKTDCHLGILKREAFEKLTRDSELKITAAIRNFMLSLPYFRQCTVFQIYRVNFIFELVQFVNNNTIYTIGEDPEYVYIVKNGEFEMEINVGYYFKQTDEKKHRETKEKFYQESKKYQSFKTGIELLADIQNDNTDVHSMFIQRGGKDRAMQIFKYGVFTEGQLFGEDDVLFGRKRAAKVRCKSNGSLYRCLATEFFKWIKYLPGVERIIEREAEEREKRISRQMGVCSRSKTLQARVHYMNLKRKKDGIGGIKERTLAMIEGSPERKPQIRESQIPQIPKIRETTPYVRKNRRKSRAPTQIFRSQSVSKMLHSNIIPIEDLLRDKKGEREKRPRRLEQARTLSKNILNQAPSPITLMSSLNEAISPSTIYSPSTGKSADTPRLLEGVGRGREVVNVVDRGRLRKYSILADVARDRGNGGNTAYGRGQGGVQGQGNIQGNNVGWGSIQSMQNIQNIEDIEGVEGVEGISGIQTERILEPKYSFGARPPILPRPQHLYSRNSNNRGQMKTVPEVYKYNHKDKDKEEGIEAIARKKEKKEIYNNSYNKKKNNNYNNPAQLYFDPPEDVSRIIYRPSPKYSNLGISASASHIPTSNIFPTHTNPHNLNYTNTNIFHHSSRDDLSQHLPSPQSSDHKYRILNKYTHMLRSINGGHSVGDKGGKPMLCRMKMQPVQKRGAYWEREEIRKKALALTQRGEIQANRSLTPTPNTYNRHGEVVRYATPACYAFK